MGVGFVVGESAWEIGSPDFLKGLFSTISYYLEPNGWGTEFPELMHDLYNGELDASGARKALADVAHIKEKLRTIRPVRIVWDIERTDAPAPWSKDNIPADTDLSNCFIASNGKAVLDVLAECLEELIKERGKLRIEPY